MLFERPRLSEKRGNFRDDGGSSVIGLDSQTCRKLLVPGPKRKGFVQILMLRWKGCCDQELGLKNVSLLDGPTLILLHAGIFRELKVCYFYWCSLGKPVLRVEGPYGYQEAAEERWLLVEDRPSGGKVKTTSRRGNSPPRHREFGVVHQPLNLSKPSASIPATCCPSASCENPYYNVCK